MARKDIKKREEPGQSAQGWVLYEDPNLMIVDCSFNNPRVLKVSCINDGPGNVGSLETEIRLGEGWKEPSVAFALTHKGKIASNKELADAVGAEFVRAGIDKAIRLARRDSVPDTHFWDYDAREGLLVDFLEKHGIQSGPRQYKGKGGADVTHRVLPKTDEIVETGTRPLDELFMKNPLFILETLHAGGIIGPEAYKNAHRSLKSIIGQHYPDMYDRWRSDLKTVGAPQAPEDLALGASPDKWTKRLSESKHLPGGKTGTTPTDL